jgi:hypothetical protein
MKLPSGWQIFFGRPVELRETFEAASLSVTPKVFAGLVQVMALTLAFPK